MWNELCILSMGTTVRGETTALEYAEQSHRTIHNHNWSKKDSMLIRMITGDCWQCGNVLDGNTIWIYVRYTRTPSQHHDWCFRAGAGLLSSILGYVDLTRKRDRTADDQTAYTNGAGSMSTWLLCFFSFITGGGSCSAFQASIKTGLSFAA